MNVVRTPTSKVACMTEARNWLENVDALKSQYGDLSEVHMMSVSEGEPTEDDRTFATEWMKRHLE